jgi:hypothetical protein
MTRPLWLIPIVGVLLIDGARAFGGEQPQQPSDQEILDLIDQLVSWNPKPITRREDRTLPPFNYRLPPGFDVRKQGAVFQARTKLRQLGPRAFPFLIERWGDEHYCLTTSHSLSEAYYNRTVGHICRAIICDQLQPYSYWPRVDGDPRGRPKRPSYPAKFLATQEQAREWCNKNKHRTLREMQLEVLDWIIAEEAKRPQDFTDEERQTLQKYRNQLVQDNQPFPAGNYDMVDIEQRFPGTR